MSRILFFASDFRPYRKTFFHSLSKNYNIDYFWNNNIKDINSKLPFSRHYFCESKYSDKQKSLIELSLGYFTFFLSNYKNYSTVVISPGLGWKWIILSILMLFSSKKKITWVEDWSFESKQTFTRSAFRGLIRILVKKKNDICVVHGTASYKFCRNLGIEKKSIFFSPHCTEDMQTLYKKRGFEESGISNKQIILYLGRIIPLKGVDILIRSFKILENKNNNLCLLLVGEGNHSSYCKSLAKKLKLQNIKFVGAVDFSRAYLYYSQCSVFVLPSVDCDGWGLVVNEAMSMGKPVVVTDAVGASFDIVKNGKNGFVVSNGNVEELATAVERIIDDEDLRLKMGENSRKYFENYNDYNKAALAFTKAIQKGMN